MRYHGRCHCGAIGFEYRPTTTPDQWSIRACQCAFCRAHDALSASDPRGSLSFFANDPARLQRYRFALRTADFLVCNICGVYIGAVIETGTGRYGIVNTHALTPPPAGLATAGPISYDDENTDGRVQRRENRWTPVTGVPW